MHFGFARERFSLSLYRTFQRNYVTKKRGQSYETDAEFYAPDGSVELHIEAKTSRKEIGAIATMIGEHRTFGRLPLSCQKEIEEPPAGQYRETITQ